jgi:hypothetical protein
MAGRQRNRLQLVVVVDKAHASSHRQESKLVFDAKRNYKNGVVDKEGMPSVRHQQRGGVNDKRGKQSVAYQGEFCPRKLTLGKFCPGKILSLKLKKWG